MAYTAMQNAITIDGDLADWSCSEYLAQTTFVPSGTQSAAADPVVCENTSTVPGARARPTT